ncbi:MAG TPA: hypothetical protein PK765_01690 [bacterium]|nr:hypothetical protein [bacterium]
MYEIEVKVLLGSHENAEKLLASVERIGMECIHTGHENQLNHYFSGGSLVKLAEAFRGQLSDERYESLSVIAASARDFSVRTRDTMTERILVVKASVNADSSQNGTARREWETIFPELSIDELDRIVLSAGFTYLSKWSRERDSYVLENDLTLTIDKNAGYGYVAEFERVIDDEQMAGHNRDYITAVIESLGFHELPQDRLERMFAHYNERWNDYYGTDRVFTVE